MKKIFTLIVFFTVFLFKPFYLHAQVANVDDSLALVALYNSAGGSNWFHNSGWLTSQPISNWSGIVLDDNGRVKFIDLGENNLIGKIPAQLGNLSKLIGLGLGFNQLEDTIPASLGNLGNLVTLDLRFNKLSGKIPESLGNLINLQGLDLHGNGWLSGSIPASLGNLSNLLGMDLSNNLLSGPIPASLNNLHNLNNLYLNYNHLSDSIPPLEGLYSAYVFVLDNNYFTFKGLEQLANNFSFATYAPQDTLLPLHVYKRQVSVSAGGTIYNNNYAWYSGGILKKTIIGDSVYKPSTPGNYLALVTNSVASQLTLNTDSVTINGDSLILPAKPNTEYASYEYTDNEGWTHYYYNNNTPDDLNDDTLLLSLKKNGEDIGTIGDGTFSVKLVATAAAGSNTGIQLTNPLITNPSGYWVMNRYWQVNPTHEPLNNVGVRFYYNKQDLADVNGSYPTHNLNNNNLIFYKTVGGNSDPTTNLQGATKIISILPGTQASDTTWTYHLLTDSTQYGEYSVSSFSGGGGGGTGNNFSLPITYLNFTAQATHDGNLLQWQTATEINSAYFNIQRSTDGVRFTNIAQVNAAGNSSTVQSYQYTDALTGLNPEPPALFYRLQEADKDGDVTYSKIITLDNNSTPQVTVSIFPNPVHEVLNVQLQGITGAASIIITDASGKTLQTQQLNAVDGSTITINSQALTAGVYFVQVLHGKQSITQKFVKE